jgi:hypothetical protein
MNDGPLFDIIAGIEARDAGIAQAARTKGTLLKLARNIAADLGRELGEVTADDVQRRLHDVHKISIHALGNAAGAIFKTDDWEFTGRFVRSERVHARGNMLRVWRWKGNG